jgi:hypothetical protein
MRKIPLMGSVRQFVFLLFICTGIGFAAIYTTSCSKSKGACDGVTCANGGSCSSGKCTCPAGTGGTFCDTVYHNYYSNIYVGNGSDNELPARTFNNYRVTLGFNDPNNFSAMTILAEALNGAGNYTTHFSAPMVLGSTIAAGTQFTITPTVNKNGFLVSGSGTVSATVVTLTVIEADTATTGTIQPTVTYTFSSLTIQ